MEVLLRSYRRLEAGWKFIEVAIGDIITRCASERERTRARCRRTSKNRGEAITRDGKNRQDRFVSMETLLPADAAPHEPPDITRMTNLKLRFAGHFRVPEG